MIKKLRVTVDGKSYDVTVEMDDEAGGAAPPASSGPVSSAPVASAPLTPAPLVAAPSAPAAGASGPGDVPSPLSGRVAAINVQAGQQVAEGEHLLTLEAMKMNTFVMAPRAGKVQEVKVAVGAVVQEGQALVTLE
ncbi:MAG: biotin/lipoyl-binding protein [Verrucomicrobiales bacterium]|nr:biotin/lipoyl-binding protein [Verrucomicrobiales bacterium]